MIGFILAIIVILLVSKTAFRGTNSAAFIVDIIALIFLTAMFNGAC